MNRTGNGNAVMHDTVDLTNCDREEIHIPGQIQRYGCLLSVSAELSINYISANCAELIGAEVTEALGAQLHHILPESTVHDLRTRFQMANIDDGHSRLFAMDVLEDGRLFDVSIHLSERNYIIELEPKLDGKTRDEMAVVNPLISRIRKKQTVADACSEATRAMQILSGFDRVMVYRFKPDGSGEVIAETHAAGMEPYLGLHYPATDIPKQARALYLRSILRLIADVDGGTSDVLGAAGPKAAPLDMSLAVTRAVSPIHLEYLRNMGVQASMSVSIIIGGRLWGLIACHHRTPRYIDYQRRTAIELFAQFLSYELTQKADQAVRAVELTSRTVHDKLMMRLSHESNLLDGFEAMAAEMNKIIPCDGIVVASEGTLRSDGATPDAEAIESLLKILNCAPRDEVFATDRIVSILPEAEGFSDKAAGLLAIPISRSTRDYILLFRREVARSVRWAGNPDKPVTVGPNGIRLTPRKSFEAWQEVVRHSATPWTESEVTAAETLRGALVEIVLRLADEAHAASKRFAERQEVLIAELNHRVRNILTLIQGLVSQTREGADNISSYAAVLDGRVQALARAHDQLTRREWEAAPLRELIETEVQAYTRSAKQQVRITGDHPVMTPEAFSTLALVIHELTTNSVKYGALSSTEGKLLIDLRFADTGHLTLHWTERGGPRVEKPTRRGFGTTIVEKTVPFDLRGAAEINFQEEGVEVTLEIPKLFVEPGSEADQMAPLSVPDGSDEAPFHGDVLLVEDNMIIALDSADIMRDNGAAEVHVASNAGQALQILEEQAVTFGLLDVNLGGSTSLAVAKRLVELGVPFVVATGYGSGGDMLGEYPPCPILRKPFTADALTQAAAKAFE